VKAEFASKCAACGEVINKDDEIVRDEDGEWIHDGCDDD
jgi:hypothetical protein